MNDSPQRGVILSSDEAKAAQEVAKVGGKVVDAVAGVGKYLAEVFDELPHDVVGIFGDVVKRTRARLAENAARKLRERGVLTPELPSPSILLPLLERADQESREELADLWAGILASAMDPQRASWVRRDFFATLAEIEPQDALVLAAVAAMDGLDDHSLDLLTAHPALGHLSSADVQVSVEHLKMLRLVKYEDRDGSVDLSAYGVVFMVCCDPSLEKALQGDR